MSYQVIARKWRPQTFDEVTGQESITRREITDGRSIDVQEIDAASHTGVGDMRDTIIETVGFAPARDPYKRTCENAVKPISPTPPRWKVRPHQQGAMT